MPNRIIRFRAWDKIIHEMYYDVDVTEKLKHPEAFELMQYTGLKDKKGKEGYHKDIVKGFGKLWVIEWQEEEARFWLAPAGDNTSHCRFMDELNRIEITGNIYQNSELLTDATAIY